MKLNKISETCYYFQSAVNIGYIKTESNGMLIDAGLDRASSKKVLNLLKENDFPLTHLFITHAHADHYGGASYIQEVEDVVTIAPRIEEAIARNPQLNVMLMNAGNNSFSELKNKFLQGEPINVDIVCDEGHQTLDSLSFETIHFPGHSPSQMGVLFDNVLYAADSYFSEAALEKHVIPFIVDANETLQSLDKVLSFSCRGAVPGHGEFETDFRHTVLANKQLHEKIYSSVLEIILANPLTLEDIIAQVCEYWSISLTSYMAYSLYRTSINAYVMKGILDKEITFTFKSNKVYFVQNKK